MEVLWVDGFCRVRAIQKDEDEELSTKPIRLIYRIDLTEWLGHKKKKNKTLWNPFYCGAGCCNSNGFIYFGGVSVVGYRR